MEKIKLEASVRPKNSSVKEVLAEGFIPVEYYGRGLENKSLKVNYQNFRKVFKKAGENTVIELVIDGKETLNVLVHDIQTHPVTDAIIHVDFINVRMDEVIHTKIPLEFVGAAPAVKNLSGVLMMPIDEIEVKCLPKDLVHNITVSVDSLVDFNCYIRVKDLNIPAGLTVLNFPEDIVATCVPPHKEEEAPVVAATPVEGAVPAEGAASAEGGAAPVPEEGAGGGAPAKGSFKK